MDIRITYTPTAQELVKASSLFVEKKPLFKYAVGFFNILVALFLTIMLLKLFKLGLNIHESIAFVIGACWLFGRRPFNEWLLMKRMQRSKVVNKPIEVSISLNGIAWAGKGIAPGSMTWDQVKNIMEAKNGFLLPNSLTRFLWLPFRGFESELQINELRKALEAKNIKLHKFKRWAC